MKLNVLGNTVSVDVAKVTCLSLEFMQLCLDNRGKEYTEELVYQTLKYLEDIEQYELCITVQKNKNVVLK